MGGTKADHCEYYFWSKVMRAIKGNTLESKIDSDQKLPVISDVSIDGTLATLVEQAPNTAPSENDVTPSNDNTEFHPLSCVPINASPDFDFQLGKYQRLSGRGYTGLIALGLWSCRSIALIYLIYLAGSTVTKLPDALRALSHF
jgi:hypothetical protein